ncbi:MAG: ROK family protein [Halofilum sp. (in: g-proteobacteria)]|nr:ROK family protein [Halofilum sp. (in: g-proteobacteria)]
MRIGIDLGGTKISALAIDDGGNTLTRRRIRTPHGDYEGTLDAVAGLVRSIEEEAGAEASVGIGTPGAISPATGLFKNASAVFLNGRPGKDDLEARLGREVRIANDANCFALSEAVDGAGAGYGVVFGVILGTGAGGGIVVDGRVLVGPNAIAGEWGHNPLPWPTPEEHPGPRCYCGQRGCIERWVSGTGLRQDHANHVGEELEGEEIARRAAAGDPDAEATLQRYEDRLSRGLAHVINLLDPDVIVLGGGVSNVERLYDNVPVLWQRYVYSDRCDTPLFPPVHGDDGGVRGAAWLW